MPDASPRPTGQRAAGVRTGWAAATGVAVVLAVAFLLAPRMGTDLAAQVARAEFADRYGVTPVDLGWYGGVNQYGYSLFTASLGALIGVRPLGAIAAVVGAAALGWLFTRNRARRPLLAGALGAVVLVGNLASGRITFAVGLTLGLLALCAVSAQRPPRPVRLALAAGCAALATAASPVAGLFTGLAGAALLLVALRRGDGPGRRLPGGWRLERPLAEGIVLAVAPAVTLAPIALFFGNGGTQPYSAESMRINVALAVLVAVVLPRRRRVLRVGALLTVLLLVGAYYVPSPIGSNALRLPLLFALPVLAGYAPLPGPWLAGLLAATVWWQSPVMTSDVTRAGAAESAARFHQPLVAELQRRQPVGRIEVVPLRDHWESAYLPPTVPLARGWERQVDTDRNSLFYDGTLSAQTYEQWLRDEAVTYVVLAPDAPVDRWGRDEAALIRAGLPYLQEVWSDPTWRMYAVVDPTPLVGAPGRFVTADRASVRLTATPGDVPVRVRWSRWLSLSGPDGCVRPGADGWTEVRVRAAGDYSISSGLVPANHC
ncbi:hypothetical protein [Micromonospora parathelypteridis]|uniref:4-amino-4-deoxy-L-arabinose transferase n=1 Tax=Micromonospora parathelypteridis TaxID=1839617 RepID=A0A840VJA1_9ACTN|nr:hypothetical protein [Micromonospora parathelypteridis]MBB5476735.1 hypothetical protein [Micromonospora parathelypteridis]GGO16735.1 MFS transporter [Micromonospora parathelypteridis]